LVVKYQKGVVFKERKGLCAEKAVIVFDERANWERGGGGVEVAGSKSGREKVPIALISRKITPEKPWALIRGNHRKQPGKSIPRLRVPHLQRRETITDPSDSN